MTETFLLSKFRIIHYHIWVRDHKNNENKVIQKEDSMFVDV